MYDYMKSILYFLMPILALGFYACDDDDEVKLTPVLSFKEKAVTVSEDTGRVDIPLALTAATEGVTTVWVRVDESSKTGGRDFGQFATCPSYITLEAGSVRGSIPLTIVDNDLPNEACSFDLEIHNVTGGAVPEEETMKCRITIVDEDSKQSVTVGFDTVRMEVGENVGILEIPVTVEGLLSDSLSLTVSSADGTALSSGDSPDYRLLTNEVKIMEGETWGVVSVEIIDGKAVKEDMRDFRLSITGVKGATDGDTTVSLRQDAGFCDVVIRQVVRKATFADSVVVLSEASRVPYEFGVKLTAPVDEDVTITIAAAEGATAIENEHYTIESKELTIKRGDTIATTVITPRDDRIGNADRYCDFVITGISGRMEQVAGSVSRVVFENDDSSVGFGSTSVFGLEGRKVSLPVYLNGLHDKRVVLEVEAVAEGDVKEMSHYMILSKKVEIAAGDSVTNVEVQLMYPGIEDGFGFGVRITNVSVDGLSNIVYREEGRQLCQVQTIGESSHRQLELDSTTVLSIVATSESPEGAAANGGVASSMIDGDPATYWHSAWADGDTYPAEDAEFGQPGEIRLMFDKEYVFTKVKILRRADNGDAQGATIQISRDGYEWKQLLDFTGFPETEGDNGSSGLVNADIFESARYMRIIPKGRASDNVCSFAELNLWVYDE